MNNNRIIKFRIWDKHEKHFIDIYSQMFGFSAFENFTGIDNGITEQFEFQQFINLLDKNGKEIYEGDILESDYSIFKKHGHFSPVYEVIFDYGKFRLKHVKSQETSIDFSPHDCFTNTLKETDVEIIGNIFENPELLNNK